MPASFLRRLLPALPPRNEYNFPTPHTYYGIGLGLYANQKPCQSIEELVSHCTYVSQQGQNAYFAMASFADYTAGRKQVNAYECKCFWADIDAGKPKSKYANAHEALAGLTQFTTETGLAPSVLVSSGMGIHAYWVLEKPISSGPWIQVAKLFHQLCIQKGFEVDPARAADIASVLRLPGTIHQSSQRPVQLLGDSGLTWKATDFLQCIANHLKPVAIPVATKSTSLHPDMDLFGMGAQPPTVQAQPIIKGCKQLLTAGISSYPQWFAAMSVLKRCTNGHEWAHKLSAADSIRYNAADTDKKFAEAADDAPTRCDTFETINPAHCATCVYKGRVKTPVQIASLTVAPPPPPTPVVAPPPPVVALNNDLALAMGMQLPKEPLAPLMIPDKWIYPRVPISHPSFNVDHRGIIWIETRKDPNGSWTSVEHIICASQLYFKHGIYEMEDQRPHRSYVFEAVHPNGKTEELRFVVGTDTGLQNIMRWFNDGNMYATASAYIGKVFMDFMNAYLSSVVHVTKELATFDDFGWHTFTDPDTKQQKTGFVTGPGVITDTGVHEVKFGKQAASHATSEFSHKGTLDRWKFVPQMYKTLGQEIGQLAVCASFAAPLMKYGSGEAKNAVLSIWSPHSGLGKSQLLRACASIWGNPERQFFSRQESPVARTRRMAVWRNLPAFMDELTDVKDEDMYGLAYTLTGGKEKNKLKSSGDAFVKTGDWSTATLTTANKSFKEAISRHAGDSEATLQRVMEYECAFQSYENQPEVQQYINQCMALASQNYGIAGPDFLYQLMQHPDRIDTLTYRAEHWFSQHKFHNKERFMGYFLYLAIQAGRWAVEFGLLDYDMDALERWVLAEFVPHNRCNTSDLSPDFISSLSSYLSDRQLHTLMVKRDSRLVTEPDPIIRGVPDKFIIALPMKETLVRVAQEDSEVAFSKTDFDNWCKRKNISPAVLLKQLATAGIHMSKESRNLGKGIAWMSVPRMKCYVLDKDSVNNLGYTFNLVPDATNNTDPVQNLAMSMR